MSRGYVTPMEEGVKEMPVIESYREGLSLINFFRSTYYARRGLIDTTLKTASSGYLTRKLVEVANELSSNQLPSLGESVGTLAAQSVGEPGTQLTLRTFHGLNETIVKGDKSMKIKNCLFKYEN